MHFAPGRKDLFQGKPRIVLNEVNVAWASLVLSNLEELKAASHIQKKENSQELIFRNYICR